jgi:hypothetical protein
MQGNKFREKSSIAYLTKFEEGYICATVKSGGWKQLQKCSPRTKSFLKKRALGFGLSRQTPIKKLVDLLFVVFF